MVAKVATCVSLTTSEGVGVRPEARSIRDFGLESGKMASRRQRSSAGRTGPTTLLRAATVFAFNALGDGLRDALDPRTRDT